MGIRFGNFQVLDIDHKHDRKMHKNEIIKKPKHRYTKELIKPVLKNIYLN